jgi:hypothetical protein
MPLSLPASRCFNNRGRGMIPWWGKGILNLVVNSGISILHQLGPVNLINIESQKFCGSGLIETQIHLRGKREKRVQKYRILTH